MNFKAFAPPDLLKPLVKYFWVMEGAAGDVQKSFTTMADGCPGLIFQQADKGILYQNGKELPDTFLFGQTTRHAIIDIAGTFQMAGVFFHPHAINSIFGFDPTELTDTCMDANLLVNKQQLHLSEQLANASSAAEQINLLTYFLSTKMSSSNKGANGTMQHALTQITQSGGNIALKQLLDDLSMTERTFERNFKQLTGMSPKLFSRICRFQSSLKQLQSSEYLKLPISPLKIIMRTNPTSSALSKNLRASRPTSTRNSFSPWSKTCPS
jgi:AraC-like DNA-binding protein